MNNGERVRRNDQSTAWLTSKFGESLFDFGCVANRARGHLNCDCPWLGLERAQEDIIMGGSIWVKHECGARNAGGRLFEYFQPLPHHLEIDECEACNVPARMRQARNETLIDGIVDRRHNDRNGACCLPERPDDRRRLADDYVGRERYQFCYVCPYAAGIGSSKAGLD